MKAILITKEKFTKQIKVSPDRFSSVLAIPKYPVIDMYTEESIDVSIPSDNKNIFFYKRRFIDEFDEETLIYEEI